MRAARAANPAHRNPPAEHRFRKGVSGNPRGRPRKSDTRTLPPQNSQSLFEKVASEPVHITINGQQEVITGPEAFMRSLQTRAIKGEASAMRLYADLLMRFGARPEAATGSHEDFLASLEAVSPEPDDEAD